MLFSIGHGLSLEKYDDIAMAGEAAVHYHPAQRGAAWFGDHVHEQRLLNRYFSGCQPYGVVTKVRSHGLLQMTIAALARGAGHWRPECPSSAGYGGSVRRYGGEDARRLASRAEH